MFRTNKDVQLTIWGASCVVPKETALIVLKDGMGADCYAVKSENLVARLTHDAHNAKRRYMWIPPEHVEPGEAFQ